ncbi:hypothetical protein BACCELL_04536 [Bacteroides cellulosilyticus DSM 14838]|uniref:Uncharacterized protein n=1 Tax=Bacteroides cellulosilyticus DSM 14838 TaxID=537012 RepID=E2NJP7_9BACE|nr:hypothetical protein BACCELL_04536 [Bacteroides cellulosilyticus DSM 14838]
MFKHCILPQIYLYLSMKTINTERLFEIMRSFAIYKIDNI